MHATVSPIKVLLGRFVLGVFLSSLVSRMLTASVHFLGYLITSYLCISNPNACESSTNPLYGNVRLFGGTLNVRCNDLGQIEVSSTSRVDHSIFSLQAMKNFSSGAYCSSLSGSMLLDALPKSRVCGLDTPLVRGFVVAYREELAKLAPCPKGLCDERSFLDEFCDSPSIPGDDYLSAADFSDKNDFCTDLAGSWSTVFQVSDGRVVAVNGDDAALASITNCVRPPLSSLLVYPDGLFFELRKPAGNVKLRSLSLLKKAGSATAEEIVLTELPLSTTDGPQLFGIVGLTRNEPYWLKVVFANGKTIRRLLRVGLQRSAKVGDAVQCYDSDSLNSHSRLFSCGQTRIRLNRQAYLTAPDGASEVEVDASSLRASDLAQLELLYRHGCCRFDPSSSGDLTTGKLQEPRIFPLVSSNVSQLIDSLVSQPASTVQSVFCDELTLYRDYLSAFSARTLAQRLRNARGWSSMLEPQALLNLLWSEHNRLCRGSLLYERVAEHSRLSVRGPSGKTSAPRHYQLEVGHASKILLSTGLSCLLDPDAQCNKLSLSGRAGETLFDCRATTAGFPGDGLTYRVIRFELPSTSPGGFAMSVEVNLTRSVIEACRRTGIDARPLIRVISADETTAVRSEDVYVLFGDENDFVFEANASFATAILHTRVQRVDLSTIVLHTFSKNPLAMASVDTALKLSSASECMSSKTGPLQQPQRRNLCWQQFTFSIATTGLSVDPEVELRVQDRFSAAGFGTVKVRIPVPGQAAVPSPGSSGRVSPKADSAIARGSSAKQNNVLRQNLLLFVICVIVLLALIYGRNLIAFWTKCKSS